MDAYVLLVAHGLTFASIGTMPADQCAILALSTPGITCVDKEPDCGKSAGNKCLGRADLPPPKATTKKRRPISSRSRTQRTARR